MGELTRQMQIIEFLQDRPFASVRELQERLGVSAATVRRDIDRIDERGGARKVYGGVSALDASLAPTVFARSYYENRDIAVDAKRAIAEIASSMVQDGESIIVHGGSTNFHLGMKLAHRNIRMFTNSMPLAAYLGENGTCALTIAGGNVHRDSGVIHSDKHHCRFYASKLFLGAQGISQEGILESHPLLVHVITEFSQMADQIVVLADSRKFAIKARNLALPLARISTIVTDEHVDKDVVKLLEDNGIEVRIAPLSAGAR